MRTVLLLAAAALVAVSTASAHHSFGATYDTAKQITLDGKIVQFVYRNPHSFVHVEAPDPEGVQQRWAIEWSGSAQLTGQGVSRDTLKVGDQVKIVGRPSRVPGEYRVLMVNLVRPADGFTWGRRANEVVD
jgi:hypothetical protein